MNIYEKLLVRIQRLRLPLAELGIAPQLALIQESIVRGSPDYSLYQILNEGLSRLEQQQLQQPFLSPPFSLDTGAITLGTTPERNPVSVTIGDGDGTVQHFCILGGIHGGKTTFAAALACEAAKTMNVLLIDSQNAFSRMPAIRNSFEFVNLRDLRLQPNLEDKEATQVFLNGFSQSYSLYYGGLEAEECIDELRPNGNVKLPKLLKYMKAKVYRFGKKGSYRDSFCMKLSSCLDGLFPLFECERGMDFLEIITRGKAVLRPNCLVGHQAFFLRYLFDYCDLLKTSGQRLQRPLLIIIDEAQLLLEHGEEIIADRLLTLRHSNVFLALCVQNPSTIPAKVLNACSVFVIFNLIDYRDKMQISKAINCTKTQFECMGTQKPREAICFIPRSYSKPFLLHVPFVQVDSVPIEILTAEFIQELEWTPLREDSADANLLRPESEKLLRDVAAKQCKFDSLSQRFLRLGIRSTSFQQTVKYELITNQFVREAKVIDVDGSKTLLAPLEKAFQYLQIEKSKGLGIGASLEHEYYQHRLAELYKTIPNHSVWTEGKILGKNVDVLVQLPDGSFRIHEIAIRNQHELTNALALVPASDSDIRIEKHYILCPTKDAVKKMKARVSKLDELRLWGRIEVMQFASLAKRLEGQKL